MPIHRDIPAILYGLRESKRTIGFAESCTGGRLSADMTTVPGSSDIVKGSLVCYMIEAKRLILGLANVNENNVVSEQTALEMAWAAQGMFKADIGVGTTGYLDGEEPHAYYAIVDHNDQRTTQRVDFPKTTTRDVNREIFVSAVMSALTVYAKEVGK